MCSARYSYPDPEFVKELPTKLKGGVTHWSINHQHTTILKTPPPRYERRDIWGVGTAYGRALTYPLRFNTWGTRKILYTLVCICCSGTHVQVLQKHKRSTCDSNPCSAADAKCEGGSDIPGMYYAGKRQGYRCWVKRAACGSSRSCYYCSSSELRGREKARVSEGGFRLENNN